ncbi:MAG: hypothetical protein MUC49_10050 [Raineya sp.]|jgi:hypothetical protein|nr:hypothetical protein [Raineya sp.]
MKNLFLFFWLLVTLPVIAQIQGKQPVKTAQKFKAKASTIFIIDDTKGIYVMTVEIEEGIIKPKDKLDFVDAKGDRRTMEVSKLTIGSGATIPIGKKGSERITIEFKMISGSISGIYENYYLVEKGGAFPNATSTTTNTQSNTKEEMFKGTFDGKSWQGKTFFNSCLYYKKGVSVYKDKPSVFILAFKSTQDATEQININIYGEIKATEYQNDKIEVLWSSSKQMYGYKYPDKNLKVIITSYQEKDANTAIVSGKIVGKLKRSLCPTCKPEIDIDGTFENITVKTFNEKY